MKRSIFDVAVLVVKYAPPRVARAVLSSKYLDQPTEETAQNLRKAHKISLANLLKLINQEIGFEDGWRLNSSPNIFRYT